MSERKCECSHCMECLLEEKYFEAGRDAARALLVSEADPLDRTQEAAHYNWLDEQNEKLKSRVAELMNIVDDLQAQHRGFIEEAVRAERERCAKIAKQSCKDKFGGIPADAWDISQAILNPSEEGKE